MLNAAPAFAQQLDLLALSGLMQSDPETALPVIEKMLAGSSSVRLKDRALMGGTEAAQALDEVYGVATDERVRREVIRGFGSSGAQDRLMALYAADQSEDVRRAVIDSLAESNGAVALVSLARNESNGALKQEMVRRLAKMRAPEARDYILELSK